MTCLIIQKINFLLHDTKKNEEDIRSIVNWVALGYGVKRAMMDAHAYGNKAREALYHFPSSPDRDVLDELIDFVVSRKK